mgnify:CR=1 FL=1
MARGINKVILVGNLGADPELRHLDNGKAVAKLSLATTDGWKDKMTGQLQERTEWHRVALFDRLAEIAQQYLKKGSKIYIEGRLQTTKWQDNNGVDRYTTEIIGREMQMLDSKGDNNAPPPTEWAGTPGAESSTKSAPYAGTGDNAPPMYDDEIPF